MSVWRKVEKDDVWLSDDLTEISVFSHTDWNGNYYLDIPIEYVLDLVREYEERKRENNLMKF